ncbi:sugar phosphate isomerase/epimerase family protein [Roseibacillus ishigakijimensis]|uniref:Twin-arginine translocation signal domain-containing protein n=1 Tax=Roseibacillus ishigakijimensis TaxID=454146 RepID=A0A934RQY3_9BACT|nr:twin-arginine translocation signal domain-containing protein [Roseibacillus ishigakijimensis]MBK1834267.1 twin-arginine translocation signal domain-containing protein [Roseibacillus ishigakijimensis]
MISRRHFLQQAGAACLLGGLSSAEDEPPSPDQWPTVLFEKPVQNLSYEEIADKVAAMGLHGLEATIRRGGHIEPGDAAAQVPGMMKALSAAGLETVIAATHVLQPDEQARDFLKVLRDNGITRYRTDYYRYQQGQNLLAQARDFHIQASKLAELNAELGMQAYYQLHSGSRLAGALHWDAALIFEGLDPAHFAIAYDLRHARTDTGLSWQLSEELVRDHVRALYIKDARWEGEHNEKLASTPLGTGFVTRELFDHVHRHYDGLPLSLHIEWAKHSIYPREVASQAWPLIERDARTLQQWLGKKTD